MIIETRLIGSIVEDVMNEEESGLVHSVFNSSFNLIFGKRLIHIGSVENGLAPFGIGLESNLAQVLTKRVRQGERVIWDARNKRLVFQNGFILVAKFAFIQKGTLVSYKKDLAILRDTICYVSEEIISKQWQSGLVESIDEQRDIFANMQLIDTNRAELAKSLFAEAVNKIAFFIKDPYKVRSQDIFDYWMGRGPGLTPSGDDILTGICASLSILGKNNYPFIQELNHYLETFGKKRTTAVAYEYLQYAVQGMYHSTIVSFSEAIVRGEKDTLNKALIEMEKIGHTSGADTLFGMMICLRLFVE